MGLIAKLGEEPGRLATGLMQHLSLMHLGVDDLSQPFVPRETKPIVDIILFAPAFAIRRKRAGDLPVLVHVVVLAGAGS